MSDFTVSDLTQQPFSIYQCDKFYGTNPPCNSSLFQIEDMTFKDVSGTIAGDPIASLQCSGAAPCKDITIEGMDLKLDNGTAASGYQCIAVEDPIGFDCSAS